MPNDNPLTAAFIADYGILSNNPDNVQVGFKKKDSMDIPKILEYLGASPEDILSINQEYESMTETSRGVAFKNLETMKNQLESCVNTLIGLGWPEEKVEDIDRSLSSELLDHIKTKNLPFFLNNICEGLGKNTGKYAIKRILESGKTLGSSGAIIGCMEEGPNREEDVEGYVVFTLLKTFSELNEERASVVWKWISKDYEAANNTLDNTQDQRNEIIVEDLEDFIELFKNDLSSQSKLNTIYQLADVDRLVQEAEASQNSTQNQDEIYNAPRKLDH